MWKSILPTVYSCLHVLYVCSFTNVPVIHDFHFRYPHIWVTHQERYSWRQRCWHRQKRTWISRVPWYWCDNVIFTLAKFQQWHIQPVHCGVLGSTLLTQRTICTGWDVLFKLFTWKYDREPNVLWNFRTIDIIIFYLHACFCGWFGYFQLHMEVIWA